MGYNAEIFANHPIQIIGIGGLVNGHYFVRDTKKKFHGYKPHCWQYRELEPGKTYLLVVHTTFLYGTTTDYQVLGGVQLPAAQVHRINSFLYRHLLDRDAAGVSWEDDPLTLEFLLWLCPEGTFGPELTNHHITELRAELAARHLTELAEYTGTGIQPTGLVFSGTWSETLLDVLEMAGVEPADIGGAFSQLPKSLKGAK